MTVPHSPSPYNLGEKQLYTAPQHYVTFIRSVNLCHCHGSHHYPSSIPNTPSYSTNLSETNSFFIFPAGTFPSPSANHPLPIPVSLPVMLTPFCNFL